MANKDLQLPDYTVGEERFSWITHLVGIVLAVAALTVGVAMSVLSPDEKSWKIVSVSVYGVTMILLYSMSTIYHALPISHGKKVFRILDHCSVSLLIAGTYTPYSLVSLRMSNVAIGWVIFGVVWAVALLNILLNAIDLKKFEKVTLALYIVMGWCIVFAFIPLMKSMEWGGILLLLLGGVFYTVGAVLYALGKKLKKRYVHSVWHLFVLAGSILQFFSILFYVV